MRVIQESPSPSKLSNSEVTRFREAGYLTFPEFFTPAWCLSLTKALSTLLVACPRTKSVVPHPVFNRLIDHRCILAIVQSLLGEDILFHHANGRLLKGTQPKPWHHDFDGVLSGNGNARLMIHLIGYPTGVSRANGCLGILPASHRLPVDRAHPRKFGFSRLEGEMEISGKPGMLVVINSALWHVRRPPSTDPTRTYFNFSYCQPGAPRPERGEYAVIHQSLRGLPGSLIPMLMRPEIR